MTATTSPTAPALSGAQKKIAELELKLAQAKALHQKQQARERTKMQSENRRLDTRRAVLIGKFILEQQKKGGINTAAMTYESAALADWLTRPDERALFGL